MVVTELIPYEVIETEYERIVFEHALIKGLQENCEACELLKEKEKDFFILKADNETIAVAVYSGIYAIYSPRNTGEKNWIALKCLLKDLDLDYRFIVFEKNSFNKLKEFSHGENLNLDIQLYI